MIITNTLPLLPPGVTPEVTIYNDGQQLSDGQIQWDIGALDPHVDNQVTYRMQLPEPTPTSIAPATYAPSQWLSYLLIPRLEPLPCGVWLENLGALATWTDEAALHEKTSNPWWNGCVAYVPYVSLMPTVAPTAISVNTTGRKK